ncbi:hypothetical protein MN116_002446 [Schistosoma mekongi]|uniref:G-protein coupled receptors family 1 profile domain-containing protein n=1 Tax=Schistosoma mekongi TaxID=38744 RepID=A0AAE1ZJP8_SCHME|nr:hypothetical protein MN116_002446 [Schistosoma mekongi]
MNTNTVIQEHLPDDSQTGIKTLLMITTTLTTNIMSSTMNIMNNTCIDHFQWLEVFHQNYQRIHVYLCLLLCPIGVIANTLNVVVLCQSRLRSPTNLLLSVLAVSDGVY